jgi:pyruvate dehydrogenase E2 component (dihydrolipoamide acetyltransferase)
MTESTTTVAITLPSFNAAMEEGTVVRWHVAVGEAVRAGQAIAEIETDKAVVELEASSDGIVESIEVPEGGPPVDVGTTIAWLRVAGVPGRTGDGPAARAQEPGEVTSPELDPRSQATPSPARAVEPSRTPALNPTGEAAVPTASGRVLASPRARRLARERGLAIDQLAGSGPGGRIVVRDIEDATVDTGRAASAGDRQSPPASSELTELGFAPGSYEITPLTGMRRTIARRLSQSFRDVPHFSLSIDVVLDRVIQHCKAINQSRGENGARISINDYVIWGAAAALNDVPDANVSYTATGIAKHRHADIAIAVAIDGGLVTPVVRAAETRSIEDISGEVRRLTERAHARRLEPAEIEGGTFTVSNLGMYGVKAFNSVLNPPQACILSVGAAEQRPLILDGGVSIVTLATMTLTCDHRAVDGVIGARLLAALKSHLESP